MARMKRDPRTKEELLNRMLSFDFDGDIRHLGEEPATVQRQGPNSLLLKFPATNTVFELSVHRPREFAHARVAAQPRSFKQERDGDGVGGNEIKPLGDGEREEVIAKGARGGRQAKGVAAPRTRRQRAEGRAQG
jgi:hypothetical protein